MKFHCVVVCFIIVFFMPSLVFAGLTALERQAKFTLLLGEPVMKACNNKIELEDNPITSPHDAGGKCFEISTLNVPVIQSINRITAIFIYGNPALIMGEHRAEAVYIEFGGITAPIQEKVHGAAIIKGGHRSFIIQGDKALFKYIDKGVEIVMPKVHVLKELSIQERQELINIYYEK